MPDQNLTDNTHRLNLRVYYEDTDAGGIVYYANYLKFAERGRTEMLRDAGVDHAKILTESDVAFAVRHCTIDYRAAARLDDELTVHTSVSRIGGASLGMKQQICKGNQVMTELDVTLVCMKLSGQAVRIPAEVREVLNTLVESSATSTE